MAERQHTAGKAKNFKRTVSFKPAGLAGEHTSGKASFKGGGEHADAAPQDNKLQKSQARRVG